MTIVLTTSPYGFENTTTALRLAEADLAKNDKRSSFVGSDFSYEDVSGRDVEEDVHKLLREEKVDGFLEGSGSPSSMGLEA